MEITMKQADVRTKELRDKIREAIEKIVSPEFCEKTNTSILLLVGQEFSNPDTNKKAGICVSDLGIGELKTLSFIAKITGNKLDDQVFIEKINDFLGKKDKPTNVINVTQKKANG